MKSAELFASLPRIDGVVPDPVSMEIEHCKSNFDGSRRVWLHTMLGGSVIAATGGLIASIVSVEGGLAGGGFLFFLTVIASLFTGLFHHGDRQVLRSAVARSAQEDALIEAYRRDGELSWRLAILRAWYLICGDSARTQKTYERTIGDWKVTLIIDLANEFGSRDARFSVTTKADDIVWAEGTVSAAFEMPSGPVLPNLVSVVFGRHTVSQADRNTVGHIIAGAMEELARDIAIEADRERETAQRMLLDGRKQTIEARGLGGLTYSRALCRDDVKTLVARAAACSENELASSLRRLACVLADTDVSAATEGFLDHMMPRIAELLNEAARLEDLEPKTEDEKRSLGECRDALLAARHLVDSHTRDERKRLALETAILSLPFDAHLAFRCGAEAHSATDR